MRGSALCFRAAARAGGVAGKASTKGRAARRATCGKRLSAGVHLAGARGTSQLHLGSSQRSHNATQACLQAQAAAIV